jgi:signal transduction histidine kinase
MTTSAHVERPAESVLLQRQNSTFVMQAGASGAVLAALLMAAYWFLDSTPDALAAMVSCAVCVGLMVGWRASNGNRLVLHAALGSLTALFTAFVAWGSIAYVAWLGLMTVLVFVLVGRRAGLVWTLIIFALLTGALLIAGGQGQGHLSQGSVSVRMLRVISVVPTLALVAYLFENQRRQNVEALERAMEARGRLLAHVSHEMRTPLNGIIGTTQALRFEAVPPVVGEGLAVIQNSGETLLALINDLLDVARAEAGRMEYAEHSFDLRLITELTVALHQPRAREAGFELRTELPTAPIGVRGDAVRVQQVLGNLVANAIRHGATPITARLAAHDEGPLQRVVLSVSDGGKGLSADEQARLFQPFVQLQGKSAPGGSGLGLFISRTIARDMGGDLVVTTPEGGGCAFTLTLALPTAPHEEKPVFEPRGALRGRVLVVDDNPINLKVAEGLLRKLGLEVETVADGEMAIRSSARSRPDLILMDLQMPGLDGFETTRRLRDAGYGAPIVALTASAQSEMLGECERAGMNGCLLKPMRLEHAVPLLRGLLRLDGP